MSLCVLVQEEDRIIIGADSREAIKINGELYATGRSVEKIRVIGDKVIFSTGNSFVASSILDEFQTSGNFSIENLERIKDRHVTKFINEHGDRYFQSGYDESQVVGLVVCCHQKGKSMVYAMSSQNSEVFKSIGDTIRLADGSRSDVALGVLKKYESNHQNADMIEAYEHVYNSLADEGIGGTLTIFVLDGAGIKFATRPIIDSRDIKMAAADLWWTREHGLIIEREDHVSKVTMNSDEMKWEVNGVKRLHYDAIENRLKFGGTLEAADGIFSGNLSAVGGTFKGALQAASGTFTGNLSAAGGTFTGTLVGVDGTFSGTIQASTIIGGFISGTAISGGSISIGDGRFAVNNAGNLTATGANLSGGSLTGAANINVSQSVTIGSKLFINPISFTAGIDLGGGIEVYHDPATRALHLRASGGIYANGKKID